MGKHLPHKKGTRGSLGEFYYERLRCQVCNDPLFQPNGAGRKRETCSSVCRQKLYRQRAAVKKFENSFPALRKKMPGISPGGFRKLLQRLNLTPSPTSDNVR